MRTQYGRHVIAPKRFEDEYNTFTPGSGFVGSDQYDRHYNGSNFIMEIDSESSSNGSYDYSDGFLVPDYEEGQIRHSQSDDDYEDESENHYSDESSEEEDDEEEEEEEFEEFYSDESSEENE
jgi:hypothetical protein